MCVFVFFVLNLEEKQSQIRKKDFFPLQLLFTFASREAQVNIEILKIS